MRPPFLTIYTPTYARPQGLARCLASVAAQTVVDDIEHIIIADHVGIGIDGMYARIPQYAAAVHGAYVTVLCDDDVLASPTAVEEVRAIVQQVNPPLAIVMTEKAGQTWPAGCPWPPIEGQIDLNCAVVRLDVWQAHVQAYGSRYEGDYDFLQALYAAGVEPLWCPVLLSRGAVSRGVAEVAA